MNMQQHNPIIELTLEQTSQLRCIWVAHRPKLRPEDFTFGKVKLVRTRAKLTKNQIYRMMMTLAETGYDDIPEWMLELTDPQEVK
jgi:hypothetical protein